MAVNYLSLKTFTVPHLNKNWLDRYYFRYNRALSSKEDGDVYTMRFPVMNWETYITVEAEIMINIKDNIIHINCYDKGTRSLYAPWYSYIYGNYGTVIEDINNIVEEKIKKMGIVEYPDKRGEQLFEIPRRKK